MSDRLRKTVPRFSAEKRALLARALRKEGLAGRRVGGDPIARRPERAGPAPLSASQERLWVAEKLLGGAPVYHVPLAAHLVGPLDAGALGRALRALGQRHELLRARFALHGERPVQLALPALDLDLAPIDLADLPQEQRLDRALELANQEFRRPFDLAQGPPVRAALWRLGEEEHLFLLSLHHIACDGLTLRILCEELEELYAAEREGRASRLSAAPLQHADFAAWQREELEGEAARAALAYWRERLGGPIEPLAFPSDRPRPEHPSSAGAWRSRALTGELWPRLAAVARAHQATPFQLLLSAVYALLHRLTRQQDLLVGVPIDLRDRVELERLPGFLVNTLVLRAAVEGSLTFAQLLERVRGVALEAYSARAAPFERVLASVAPGRDPWREPLLQVMYDHRADLAAELGLSGLASGKLLGEEAVHSATAKVDLALYTEVRGETLTVSVEYRTDLFGAPTIERLLERFEVLLGGIAADPAVRIDRLPLLGARERALVLETWPHGPALEDRDSTVHAEIAVHAETAPERTAVVCGDRKLSYHELEASANRLARHLRGLGVARGEPVALCVGRSSDLVVALLGILKAGGAYLPLDPEYPFERLRFMLEDSGARVLVSEEPLVASLPDGLRAVLLDRDRAEIEGQPAVPLKSPAEPGDPAYLIYTSGSTGIPKGVACPHRGVLRLFRQADWLELDPLVRMAHLASESFDASVLDIWGPLVAGGTLVLHPERTPTLAGLARTVAEHRIDTLFLTTALFHVLVDEAPEILTHLRQVAVGGEALSLAHLRRARELFPRLRIANCYGPTEATVIATRWVAPQPLPAELATAPIGTPIPDTSVYVLDEHRQPVPIGVPGELHVGGAGIALGYWKRPELTAERFVANPFGPGRLYRTGDRVRWRAAVLTGAGEERGELELLGRDDDQVKIRGQRVELGEIEARLAKHPQVRQALVLARADARGAQRLVAYVVPEPGAALAPAELSAFLEERLPEYLRPSVFVVLAALPLTSQGKLDRARLPAPQPEEPARPGEAPASEIETLLAAQWAELLRREPIGRDQDFFELGGHSLLATVLIARVVKIFGVELPLAAFFRERTVARLARLIEERRSSATAPAPVAERPRPLGRAPLSFNQRGLWFLHQLAPEKAVYNVPFALALHGALDLSALERALAEIGERHEALRTVFSLENGEPVQALGTARFALETLDLRKHKLARREAEDRLAAFARKPFDLEQGPLFRALLVRMADEEATLAVNVHHAVFDGWSLDVLLDELTGLYAAFARGEPSPLAPLALQYADWARQQRARLSEERTAAELSFWKQELAGAPPVLELPGDRARPAVPTWRGARVRRELPPGSVARLRALARATGATPYLAGLALAQALLARLTGAEDLVVGTPVAARTDPACERSIGLFLNVLALRADLSGDPSFRALLERTRERVLRAHAHQGFPFERLVDALGSRRDPAVTPIYQVLFSLRRAGEPREAAGVRFEPARELDAGTAKTELAITIEEAGEGLVLDLNYATDRFERATLERFAEHFERLLAAALADPERSIWELEYLAPEERALLLEEWSGPRASYPREESMAQLFERAVERSPQAVALVFECESFTYRELNERANRLAHLLVELGVERETRVALVLERSSDLIVALLATCKAGGAYVPLDPSHPRQRLALLLEESGAALLLTDSRLRAGLPPTAAKVVVVDEEWPEIDRRPAANPPARSSGADLAYVMYTSGSTGRPKGVQILQRSISRLVFGANYATLDASCTFLQLAPISFDASTLEIWGALLQGGKLVLHPGPVPAAEELERLLAEHGVTTLWLTAALFNAIVDERPQALAPLRECLTGGEALSVAHVRKAYEHLPASVQLINGYGPTENTTFTCCHRIPRELPPGLTSIPIGRPITNTKVYVVDRRLRPVPVGVVGELVTGGDGLARGYLGRPELDAERFVPNPFGPGRLYRTGDLVRWLAPTDPAQCGTLEFLGRTDDQVKIRGHRIEPGEVAGVLGEHPGLRKAFVAAHEDPQAGKRLVAYLVARDATAAPRAEELAAWLSARLPDYLCPASYTFLEELPMSPNGKVDRARLPEPRFEERAAERPRNELERLLASLWERVLGVEGVGPEHDFFELGGHSLLAVKLVQEIRDALGQELELSSLIAAPTLGAQARLLQRGVGTKQAGALVKLQPAGSRPPIFCVCSLGGTVLNQRPLALRLGPEQPFYGLQALDLDAKLGRPATIEDYAAAYIEAMKSVAPRGPYVVGGHSFGGIVSYEIAQQLTGRGDEVALLFILDSSLPNLDRGLMDRLAGLLAFARGLPYLPAEAWWQARHDPGQLAHGLRRKLRPTGGRARGRGAGGRSGSPAAASSAGAALAEIVEMRHWPENNRKIAERHWRAVLAYRPKLYPGRITLFRSRFHSPFLGLGRQIGWDRVTLGGVEVVPVPGGHLSVLLPPNVDVLARKLGQRLARRRRAA